MNTFEQPRPNPRIKKPHPPNLPHAEGLDTYVGTYVFNEPT